MKPFKPILVFEFGAGTDKDEEKLIQETMRSYGMTPSGLPASDRADLYRHMTRTTKGLINSNTMPSIFPMLLQTNRFFADRNVGILGVEVMRSKVLGKADFLGLRKALLEELTQHINDERVRDGILAITDQMADLGRYFNDGIRIFYRNLD
ncbi:hypothetical protein WDW86_15750 [Bdellovibrionota bacterium FG-2]